MANEKFQKVYVGVRGNTLISKLTDIILITDICGQACKNQPCEHKLHLVIFYKYLLFRNEYALSVNFKRFSIKTHGRVSCGQKSHV